MTGMISFGNIAKDSQDTRGWLVGAFEGAPISNPNTEIKVLRAEPHYKRPWVDAAGYTTLMLVLTGCMITEVGETQSEPGTYVTYAGEWLMWTGQNGYASWADNNETSVVVCVRWRDEPSA